MKKKYIHVSGALFIGLLALSSLSSCAHTKKGLGNVSDLVGPQINQNILTQPGLEHPYLGALKGKSAQGNGISECRVICYFNPEPSGKIKYFDKMMESAKKRFARSSSDED
ncbi:hypothetical protein [Cardinium endosymbiont of Nabis limbatus]|uniref:hypothetical protein n=1 Tax=Cardinium endosymbiont of Nabis limbatus TaxID=3066217 RepID=UPI003AF3D44F